MNMQAMLKQAQKMQRDMMNAQEEINNTEFVSKSSLVTVTMAGTKEVKSVEINADELDKDDIEMLQDMIMVATNDCIKQINDMTEQKMGAYTKGMPGLF